MLLSSLSLFTECSGRAARTSSGPPRKSLRGTTRVALWLATAAATARSGNQVALQPGCASLSRQRGDHPMRGQGSPDASVAGSVLASSRPHQPGEREESMRTTSTGSSGRKRALGAGTFALLAVLACAATAGAVPRLFVYEYDYQPAAGSTVDMALAQEKGDPAPAKIIFALQGGTIDVGKVPGTTVGAAAAIATTDPASVFDGSSATFSGPIVAADPADHVTDGTACTGRTTHDAVWTLQLASRGQSLPLTLFVDRA